MRPDQRPILRFLCHGDWPLGAVTTDWTANSRPAIPAVEVAIETAWQAARDRLGPKLFDGPMCRLESWTADPQQLHLRLSPSSYKPFLGTNMSHPELAAVHGEAALANPVGVSPVLLTCDGSLLLGRRNQSVAYYPGRVHPFAGCLEPKDVNATAGTAPLGVFAAVYRELHEELDLAPIDLLELRCLGMAMDQRLLQAELIFFAPAKLTRAEIESRLDPEEHHAVFAVAANGRAVEAALAGGEAFTPVAIATLLLWGRRALGTEWFSRFASSF